MFSVVVVLSKIWHRGFHFHCKCVSVPHIARDWCRLVCRDLVSDLHCGLHEVSVLTLWLTKNNKNNIAHVVSGHFDSQRRITSAELPHSSPWWPGQTCYRHVGWNVSRKNHQMSWSEHPSTATPQIPVWSALHPYGSAPHLDWTWTRS